MSQLAFGRPMAARHWLQASNPSERWKWDFMFQDLPPVKGSVDPEAVPMPLGRDSAAGSEKLKVATFKSVQTLEVDRRQQ